jgi:hypothetical protein
MKIVDYVYYCIYRFFLRTPIRSDADVWPGVFLPLTLCIHALTIYFLWTLFDGRIFAKAEVKIIGVVAMVLLLAASCWHYVWKENGARVIRSFERRGNETRYALLGAIMFIETACLPLGLSLLLILTQKLTGWPPRP